MFKFKNKWKKVLVTSLALVTVLGTVAFGASKVYVKDIPATYGRVKFNYNGTDVTAQVENKYGTPGFISGGRSYVPVRALADVLGVNVTWNETTSTAYLTGGGNTAILENQIAMKDLEIARLNAKIKELQNENSGASLRDIEKDLQKDYSEYEKVDFDIKLRGSERKMDLEIDVDLSVRRNRDNWENLRERDVERFIENMVRDIQKEHRDAEVKGYIRDSDAREDLYTFEKDGTRSIDIRKRNSSSNGDRLKDMERDLEKRYADDLKGIKKLNFIVEEKKKDQIKFTVELDFDRYEDEWKDLKDSKIETFMENIQSYISDDYRKYDIEGLIISDDGKFDLAEISPSGRFKRIE